MSRPKSKNKKPFVVVEKDDGSRWNVVDSKGNVIYAGEGVRKSDALRLASGLVQEASIKQVS